jgi:IS5 family transposase
MSDQPVVNQYHTQYNSIDKILEGHPKLLDLFHRDLINYGSSTGRESGYSSEQVLRMLLVKCIEGLSFRDLIIRVCDSDFLRYFIRIGMTDKLMSFGFLDGAFKCIKESTWKEINELVEKTALKEKKISGDQLRLDSTAYESTIHYPTDTSLLWDSYRVIARMIRQCTQAEKLYDMGSRFHEKKVKSLYTFIAQHSNKENKSTKRKVKRSKQLLLERGKYSSNPLDTNQGLDYIKVQ